MGYFKHSGAEQTFSDTFTYAGDSLGTMVDSDGLVKWKPHNLLTYSEQFDNGAWVKLRGVVVSNQITAPDGTLTADVFQQNGVAYTQSRRFGASGLALADNTDYTASIFVKKKDFDWHSFLIFPKNGAAIFGFVNLNTGAIGPTTGGTYTINVESVGDGWFRIDVTFNSASGVSTPEVYWTLATADNDASLNDTNTFGTYFWGAHLYRSDLGGMVDNIDRGDSYVPTTTTAVYAARAGHHRYDGASWVKKGLLLESEARTNLLLNSGTLSTQNVTVSAVQYALSFTGTGTVTLSGASTAGPLVGTGTGENNRVSLVFTPSAGTLTLTVSGTVTNAQLEAVTAANPYPSSYIPTSGATVTRAAETLSVAAANMPYDATAMAVHMRGEVSYADNNNNSEVTFTSWVESAENYFSGALSTLDARTGQPRLPFQSRNGGFEILFSSVNYTPGQNVAFSFATRALGNGVNGGVINIAADGTAVTEEPFLAAGGVLPDLSTTDFQIGTTFNGTISQILVWNEDIGDTGIVEATA